MQQDPTLATITFDEANGFNSLLRSAIAKGLEKLPANLFWLRVAFRRFYSGCSKLSFGKDANGDWQVILCVLGVHQGDGAGMAYFACGMDEALMQLRAEFPDTDPSAFADDVHATVSTTERVVASETLRPFKEDAVDMPVAVAMAQRWEALARDKAGLRVRFDKTCAASPEGVMLKDEYGPIPRARGVLVSGVPVGAPEWERAKAAEIAQGTERLPGVARTFDCFAEIDGKQYRDLLDTYCGGLCRITHLIRTLRPDIICDAAEICDTATKAEFCKLSGVAADKLSDPQWEQARRPLRHGGEGVRLASDVCDAALVGGFAAAAYLGHSVGQM